jgi:hypothetical protein
MLGEVFNCREDVKANTPADDKVIGISLSSVLCYWAGSGYKFNVFDERGKVILKKLLWQKEVQK